MINLILQDKQAIILYRVLMAATRMMPDVTLMEIQASLGYQLAPLEVEAYKHKHGWLVCQHCMHVFQDKHRLTGHVMMALGLQMPEAKNQIHAWYLPDIILGEE